MLQETLGVDCIPKEKLAKNVTISIGIPSVKADKLLNILSSIDVQPGTKTQINKIFNIMKWSNNATKMIAKNNWMQKAIVIFNPGRFDTRKNLYDNPNTDGNTVKHTTADEVKIVEAIRESEQNNMWISSLKANPDCDEP